MSQDSQEKSAELSAELRQLARQWMLAETGQLEYRQKRAAVLAEFAGKSFTDYQAAETLLELEDPTAPQMPAISAEDIEEQDDTLPDVNLMPPQEVQEQGSKQWIVALLGLIVFVGMLVALFTF